MPKTIILIRHAEPLVVNGERNGITQEGERATRKLSQKIEDSLSTLNAVAIIYSPVKRCAHTARLLSDALAVNAKEAPLRFLHIENMKKNDTESKYTQYISSYQQLGIESPEAYIERFLKLVRKNESQAIIVVANEVNIRILLQHFSKKPYNKVVSYTSCFMVNNIDDEKATTIQEVI